MKIAFLTAGGIAPCLSSSIGALIESYNKLAPEAEMIGYLNGYRGLLQGKSLRFPEEVKTNLVLGIQCFLPYNGIVISRQKNFERSQSRKPTTLL